MKPEELKKIICVPEFYDDSDNTIYFEPGLCNIKEFTEMRAKNKIYWYNKIEELKGIMYILIQFVIQLAD